MDHGRTMVFQGKTAIVKLGNVRNILGQFLEIGQRRPEQFCDRMGQVKKWLGRMGVCGSWSFEDLIANVQQEREVKMKEIIVVSNVSCAIICAKWALDLGYSQGKQNLFLIGGLILGPLMLALLYVRLVNKAKKDAAAGG